LLLAYPLLVLLFGRLFPEQALSDAEAILPYALVSLLMASIAQVFQSGLDGCQRYDWRALLIVTGQVAFLLAALWLTPRYGLVGLAWAQIFQCGFLLVGGWWLIRRVVPRLPWIPRHWRLATFREMLGYGLQFQLGAIAIMLLEPLTKALLGKFGGLSSAGYYEMAQQYVGKVRLLVVSANQVLVPVAATLNERDPDGLRRLYIGNVELLLYVVLPLYALVASWGPILSELWIGNFEAQFVLFVNVLALAWAINTFASPAYFAQMGTGRLLWNTSSHVWIGLANAGLGFALGPRFGATAIIWGMAAALVTGSLLVVLGFHRDYKISWSIWIPREAVILAVASAVVSVAVHYAYNSLGEGSAAWRYTTCLFIPVVVLAPLLWIHSQRPLLHARILGMLNGEASRREFDA
jgi:O-antigen/teichoic acid export membrane protein